MFGFVPVLNMGQLLYEAASSSAHTKIYSHYVSVVAQVQLLLIPHVATSIEHELSKLRIQDSYINSFTRRNMYAVQGLSLTHSLPRER